MEPRVIGSGRQKYDMGYGQKNWGEMNRFDILRLDRKNVLGERVRDQG